MATGVGLSKVLVTPLNWPTLKTPYWVQVDWSYLLCMLSYSPLCVLKFTNFRYHGNRGRSEQSLTITLKLGNLKTPYWVQVSPSYLLRKLSYSQYCVEIHKLSQPWQQGSV